ncbi:MAG: 4-hydroxy-tetrahydrodipicolinate synthase [Peptococcaceae bacterium]
MDFGRVLTAMVTPFTDNGEVDYEEVKRLAVYLIENGNDSLLVCGTTAETPTLTHDEKVNIVKTVKEAVGDRAKIVVGTGTNCTRTTIEATKEMEALGADGILVVEPYYNKPSQEGLYQHFKAVAEATSLPVILYNIPGRCGINMSPELIARLAQIPNIVAVKEAAGSIEQVSKIKTLVPDDFIIYSGDDSLTLPMMAVGAYGIISVAAHVVGRPIRAMVDAYAAGKVEEAAALHKKLYPIFKSLFITSNPVPVKYALSQVGIGNGKVRLPLVEASDADKAVILQTMKDLDLV